MKGTKNMAIAMAGVLVGSMLTGPAAHAAESYLKAYRNAQAIYLDGTQIQMEAYTINGSNYVKLRDVGKALDFNVYWQDGIQINSGQSYTGEVPASTSGSVTLPTDGSRYTPRTGDVIACDDGTEYTITDVSRYDKSMFASGPLPDLPSADCDWSSFPEVKLPEAEARHFDLEAGDYLFIRNLYESRRMQYTIQNLAGNHPDTSEGGRLKYGSKGTPAVRISLTIDKSVTPQSFWPWRESELERLFNSCPAGNYQMEAWDVYRNGTFLYTEYKVYAL